MSTAPKIPLSSHKQKRKSLAHHYKWLRKWHYRMGTLASIFFIVLAVTGVGIQQAKDLHLDQRAIPAPWAHFFYNQKNNINTQGYLTSAGWISQTGASLYVNHQPFEGCTPPLLGAVTIQNYSYAICQQALWIFNQTGEEIEKIDLPIKTPRLMGSFENRLFLSDAIKAHYYYDDEQGDWISTDTVPNPLTSPKLQPMPQDELMALQSVRLPNAITWERLLLDIHSGRLAGHWGSWFMNAMALALILSSLTGLWMWRRLKR